MERFADRTSPGPSGPALRLLLGLSGALAAGLVVLTLLLAVAQWRSGLAAGPGPGAAMIGWHGTAAALAVALQWGADRSRGARATTAALAVVAVAVGVLWLWWWR